VADTVGAGICQTATTLYDAALYAELNIVERYNHTMVVHYSEYGMDATIYAGNDYKNPSKDLKLKNDYDYPVYIEASASGGVCKFTIYGKETRASNREVKYISETLEEKWPTGITYINDSSKKVGYTSVQQSAYPYVKATLTKVVYVDGVETERELLHTDTYQSSNKKVVRGTKQPETKAATTKAATKKAAETTKAAQTTKAAETTKAAASKEE
jgi:vancomycin resistance protein YoaR